jgi:hypothetical protein
LLATRSGNAVSITTTSAPVTVPAQSFSPPPYSQAPSYPPAPSYSASLPAAPMASPDERSASAGYPAPVCASEISGVVVDAPLEHAVPGSTGFSEPNLVEPVSPVEAAIPLEAASITPAIE